MQSCGIKWGKTTKCDNDEETDVKCASYERLHRGMRQYENNVHRIRVTICPCHFRFKWGASVQYQSWTLHLKKKHNMKYKKYINVEGLEKGGQKNGDCLLIYFSQQSYVAHKILSSSQTNPMSSISTERIPSHTPIHSPLILFRLPFAKGQHITTNSKHIFWTGEKTGAHRGDTRMTRGEWA